MEHPNIIPIYDAGESEGIAYIAMRYIQGYDLADLIDREGPLDLERAVAILDQAGGALDAAHALDVLHRDVKPANVMLDEPTGRVYLTDFGIAKQAQTRGLTRTGFFIGTLDYAPPEQIEGKQITHAADVYAFGCMLFEVLTGRKPFEKESDVAVMHAHLSEEPPSVIAIKPGLPSGIDDVIARAMAKSPEERLGSCREVIDAVRALQGQRSNTAAFAAVAAAPAAKAMPWQEAIAGARAAERPEAKEHVVSLPPVPGSIIGREADIERISDELRSGETSILTITGLAGVGKTRLALEVASRIAEDFEGVYFVDLSTLVDPDLVGPAVAAAVGADEAGDRPMVEALRARIGDERILLVFDNFEHVLAAASFVAELAAAVPTLKSLITSQAPLHVLGEQDWPLPPLELPERETTDEASIVASPAVQLFVERAQAVKPGFEVTADNARAVAEICMRLDGLPLAIELAAARLKLLNPQALLQRLEKRLDLLTGGASGQQTLRGAIDWSYQLLEETERAMLARLGVFAGSCSLEAAEAVCATEELTIGEVMDGLASLVDKSLVRQEEDAQGEPRFRLLETIREYALEQLEVRGEAAKVRERHAERYAELAEAAEPELLRPGQAAWLARLDEENENIRAALAWSLESGQIEYGLRIAGALVRFWSTRGLMTEGRHWLDTALARGDDTADPVLTKALFAAGYAALGQGDYEQAQPFFEKSLALAEARGDQRVEAACLAQLGWLLMTRGEADEAAARSQQSLELARASGDTLTASGALNILAELASARGDSAEAALLLEESVALRRQLGDKRLIANSLLNLGRHALNDEQYDRATGLLNQGLALAQELRDTWSMSVALLNLARVHLYQGSREPAQALFAEALTLASDRGDARVGSECLQGLAAATASDQAELGARLWGAADALLESTGAAPTPAEHAIAERFLPRLREELGEEPFAAATATGRSLTFDEAAALALEGVPQVGEETGAAVKT
jgi:non-specific serine/threonine protein kinase